VVGCAMAGVSWLWLGVSGYCVVALFGLLVWLFGCGVVGVFGVTAWLYWCVLCVLGWLVAWLFFGVMVGCCGCCWLFGFVRFPVFGCNGNGWWLVGWVPLLWLAVWLVGLVW
jgi:hypothetical protein